MSNKKNNFSESRIDINDLTSTNKSRSITEFIMEKSKQGRMELENQIEALYTGFPFQHPCELPDSKTEPPTPTPMPYRKVYPDVHIGDPKIPARRRVPDDVTPGGVIERKQFISIDDLLENIRTDSRENKDLAISITGGGARGPYEAGVIEAIFKKIIEKDISRPRIVSGTSAGAIVATCAFIDLLYPPPPPVFTKENIERGNVYYTRQAKVWREISNGNNASATLFSDRAWIIEYATGKKSFPGISLFFGKNLASLKHDSFSI